MVLRTLTVYGVLERNRGLRAPCYNLDRHSGAPVRCGVRALMRLNTDNATTESGFSLIEMLIALGLLGIIGVAFALALSGALRAQDLTRERVASENLARAALEEIRNQVFLTSYSSTVPVPPGYAISIDTQEFCTPEPCTTDGNLQMNTVKVSRGGQTVVRMEDLKSRR